MRPPVAFRHTDCSHADPFSVCIPEMGCLHDADLAARWDWVSKLGDSATGWIACGRCGELLQRLSYAGGRFRSHGWYLGPFLQQTATGARVAGLEELEVEP